MKPLIVKLGGSVITDKRKPFVVKRATLRRLARELAAAKGPLIIVHGGGSFGHPVASKYGIAKGYKNKNQLMGLSLTHRAMEQLNTEVIEAFQKEGLPAIAVQPSACVVVSTGRIQSMELAPIRKLLELGLIPVLYGDAVPDISRGMSILSGDQIVAYLAGELGASRVILGVDVDGVYMTDPKKDKNAKLVQKITPADEKLIASLGSVEGKDVTGGMENKVRELLSVAKPDFEAKIVNATKPDVLKRAVQGERFIGSLVAKR